MSLQLLSGQFRHYYGRLIEGNFYSQDDNRQMIYTNSTYTIKPISEIREIN